MTMSEDEGKNQTTQHALLAALGEFARQLGMIEQMESIKLHQKSYHHTPQTKVLEFLVATLAGLEHLKEVSRSAHPLDQDRVVAEAWGQLGWADYSGVSRTLQALKQSEADQIMQVLEKTSQMFITSEVNLALLFEQRLVYDGDLTGLAVSKSSTTYPGVAYGHMDEQICLGYQAAVVSLRSPTYQRLWLSVNHHPGNWVSALAADEMIWAAERRTGVRPWRRTELLEQRLQGVKDYSQTLRQKLVEREKKVSQAQQAVDQIGEILLTWKAHLADLTAKYVSQQRAERPTSQLAKARHKLTVLEKRSQRRAQTSVKAQQVVAWTRDLIAQQQSEQDRLQERLERFQRDNATNPHPIQAVFRLDAGFGTYENLALLIEMGYEVYTKLQYWKTLQNLIRQVPPEASWTPVGGQASLYAWKQRLVESFYYPIDVGVERFTDGEERVKYCALLHYGPTSVTQDLSIWFNFYSGRQIMEAGIKESKQMFYLHRLKVRSQVAIALQENFVLFAANFIRWAMAWLEEETSDESQRPGGGGASEASEPPVKAGASPAGTTRPGVRREPERLRRRSRFLAASNA